METGSITAWTAYNAAAKITMPRTSMHQSQNLNQSQVGVGIRGNVVHHMTYKMLDVVEICHFAFTIDA